MTLPQKPGHYLWYICDWGYLRVGSVHVLKDTEKHLSYLLEHPNPDWQFYVYETEGGEMLTMYHDAQDGLPPVDRQGRPVVDGFREYDFWWLVGNPGPWASTAKNPAKQC